MEEVQGCNVVCKALNDAVLGGLLTVIHSEENDAGMSDLQVVLLMPADARAKALSFSLSCIFM